MRGFRQFSAYLTKCHARTGICTLSPLHAALTMLFAKNEPEDTSKVLRLPGKIKMDTSKVLRAAMITTTHRLKRSQKYCACHTKQLLSRCETCLNVTMCHACHAKRYATFETPKSDPFCRTRHRHGHAALARTVADGCEQLRTVANGWATSSEHTLNPQTPRVKREPLLRIREKDPELHQVLRRLKGVFAKSNR